MSRKSSLTEDQLIKIKELHSQNYNMTEIGKMVGTSRKTVQRTLNKMGLYEKTYFYASDFTPELLSKIKELSDQRYGSRKIASVFGLSRRIIKSGLKILEIDVSDRKTPKYAYKYTEQKCARCGDILEISQFREIKTKRWGKEYFRHHSYCFICEEKYWRKREETKRVTEKYKITNQLSRTINYNLKK